MPRYTCSMLTEDGRCSQYEIRPMICRLYGAAEGIECSRGCKPIIGFAEGVALLGESMKIGGGDAAADAIDWQGLQKFLARPDAAGEFKGLLEMLSEPTNPKPKE